MKSTTLCDGRKGRPQSLQTPVLTGCYVISKIFVDYNFFEANQGFSCKLINTFALCPERFERMSEFPTLFFFKAETHSFPAEFVLHQSDQN